MNKHMTIKKIPLNSVELRSKIYGCWLGKAVGGTLGGPHEGKSGPLNMWFYDPVPTAILPNDDLDLQVVWLCYLLNNKCSEVTSDLLSDAWHQHVDFPWDEYGICHRNTAYGLKGYRRGSVDNFFGECMGAAIRSEIWACLAPGDPDRAAGFAWADSACDHSGDGIWAEVFFAALEAAAFVESDRDRLIQIGLIYLPLESRVRDAILLAIDSWSRKKEWPAVREEILASHENGNFTDVAANLAFTILGWLAGEGDFGKSICIANNCGMDTDCSAATLGSIMGIIDPDCIPTKWRKPIGEAVILNPQIKNLQNIPRDLAELTDQTLRLSKQLENADPKIQEIVARLPQSESDQSIQIPVQIGYAERTVLRSTQKPDMGDTLSTLLPGHWIRRQEEDFQAPVMLLKYTLDLEKEEHVQIMAWSQTQTRAWINGDFIKAADPDVVCARRMNEGAPSFHRGGHGHFALNQSLPAGTHELIVAWERPRERADLVVGVANEQTKQWIPFALWR
jgi:ADP-ribosylglycohydrolase